MFDTIALSILALSILYSIWKGMVREAFSLLALVASYLLASRFYLDLRNWIGDWIPAEVLAQIISFVVLFLSGLFVMATLGYLARKFLRSNDAISGWDRILGGLFGMAKGVFILVVFMLPLQWFDETYARLTEDSVMAPYLESWVEDLRENVGPAFSRSLPGSLKGLRKQVSGLDEIQENLAGQKEHLEETITSISETELPPLDNYTDRDRRELDSILNTIEDEYKNPEG